tara:strand:+ start:621 stop:1181 length:561 start_codon:yes stop_codon:yes gene_type:complete
MNTAEGVVETIRAGRGVSASISGAWYGAGFDASKLPFKEGNTIKFAYTEKGIYKNMDLKSVEVIDASENTNMKEQQATPKVKVTAGATVTRDSYWSNKEEEDKLRSKEIRYEACLQRAISMVDLLITSGALTLGANAKKKVEIIDSTVDAYTRKFYEEATEARDGAFDAPSTDDTNKDLGEEASYE